MALDNLCAATSNRMCCPKPWRPMAGAFPEERNPSNDVAVVIRCRRDEGAVAGAVVGAVIGTVAGAAAGAVAGAVVGDVVGEVLATRSASLSLEPSSACCLARYSSPRAMDSSSCGGNAA